MELGGTLSGLGGVRSCFTLFQLVLVTRVFALGLRWELQSSV